MTDGLSRLLKDLQPEQVPGRFVFVTLPKEGLPGVEVLATVQEDEGLSAVVRDGDAMKAGLDFDFVAAWITLRVDSTLSDIGLTAAVSTRLTEEAISCNVIAGLRHDHILVPVDEAERALDALRAL